ncbi:MAG TPA: NADH-quinone oxidoreductase subunit N [Thermoanaerobaculia bacterium]|nr:NADH-quinone oxidoreductase subunit N [Thermoanaerobaculia bacterium]
MNLQPLLEPGWVNAILPEILLSVGGMFLILFDAFVPRAKGLLAPIALILFIAAAWTENLFTRGGIFFGGTYEISGITMIFDLTFLLAGMLATLFAREYLEREGIEDGAFYALLMWGTVGMMMMAKGLDLILVILGLEILSVCIFVLVGFHRRIPVSNEASLKYFLMGAFATGFILYGTALFYGATASTNFTTMGRWFAANEATPLLTVAFVLMMSGFGFKLALAPFHPWAPDVYQGAPTPVAAWLSVAPKAATLIALIRLFDAMEPVLPRVNWMGMVAVLAVLSMVVGNAVAIVQRDLKRMLAYSGIAHVGYMMIAMLTVRDDSVAAIAVYTITYALMNIGAFGVVSLLMKNENDPHTLDDIAGLGFRRKFYGFALAICMFSLAGLPPTAGFISKFYIFKTAIESGHTTVALLGILASIISVYYYLRVVYYLYMKEPTEGYAATPQGGVFALGALTIAVVGIIAIGVYPSPLFQAAGNAARAFLQQ